MALSSHPTIRTLYVTLDRPLLLAQLSAAHPINGWRVENWTRKLLWGAFFWEAIKWNQRQTFISFSNYTVMWISQTKCLDQHRKCKWSCWRLYKRTHILAFGCSTDGIFQLFCLLGLYINKWNDIVYLMATKFGKVELGHLKHLFKRCIYSGCCF